ncbi:hypothetical protein JCM19238_109 [Vibrio ponticus]|nr:hypothetical protein JCM19238_109 [Vibrio ponticus]
MPYADAVLDLWSTLENIMLITSAVFILAAVQLTMNGSK